MSDMGRMGKTRRTKLNGKLNNSLIEREEDFKKMESFS